MFGFLNIYKPTGMTSHDVIAFLRGVTKIKQIGHTGTLDPFAEGVLPVCIGKSTRLIEYLNEDKAYSGTIQLGKSTTTYDIEGEVTNCSDKKVTLNDIREVLKFFEGEIEQIPPIYSAIKVKGKKLYEYARKGEAVEIKPRKVTIKKLEVLNFDEKNRTIELHIECSKGTYIRSIANDIGEKLGTYGHLVKLIRTKAGDFEVINSIPLNLINNIQDVENNLINPLNYLYYPKYELIPDKLKSISNGNSIQTNTCDGTVVLVYNGQVTAIGECKNSLFKCSKVFI